jgi:probable rRNA maturation factor
VVEMLNETPQPLPLDDVTATLERYLEAEGVWQVVTVVLIDDDAMRARNLADRGEDEPTDVLSYPMVEPDDDLMPATGHLGDIFISVDTAARQAQARGVSLDEELLALAAHGVTHLRGFDHPTEDAWRTFLDAEARILALWRAAP